MKIIVAGSRSFEDYKFLEHQLDKILKDIPDVTIISGHARGADRLAEKYARSRGFKLEIYPADWKRYGKAAGYRRNEKMAMVADMLIAFWDGVSKGTKHMIEIMRRRNKKVHVIKFKEVTMHNIFIDGSSKGNPGPAGIGIYCKELNIRISVPVGQKTNNEAEYLALIGALSIARGLNQPMVIHSDSKLVVEQFNGSWKVKKPHLLTLLEHAKELATGLDVEVKLIPRDENMEANALAQAASEVNEGEYVIVDPELENLLRKRLKEQNKNYALAILPENLIQLFPSSDLPKPVAVVVTNRGYVTEWFEVVLVASERMWYINGKPYAKADWVNKVE